MVVEKLRGDVYRVRSLKGERRYVTTAHAITLKSWGGEGHEDCDSDLSGDELEVAKPADFQIGSDIGLGTANVIDSSSSESGFVLR